jgi:hypothetical protein
MPEPRILKSGGPSSRKVWVTADVGGAEDVVGRLEVCAVPWEGYPERVWLSTGLRAVRYEDVQDRRGWKAIAGYWEKDKFGCMQPVLFPSYPVGLGPAFVCGFSPGPLEWEFGDPWKVCLAAPAGQGRYLYWRVVAEGENG